MELIRFFAAIAMLAGWSVSEAAADGLADIKARGKILVVVDTGNRPFAYMDASFKPTGSEVETARLLAKDLGVELEFVPANTANRVQFLVSNKADIAIAALAITEDRKKVIDFSITHAEAMTVIAAPKALAIKSFADLAGKSIVATRATINDIIITKETAGLTPKTTIVRFEDDPTASLAITSGQQQVYITGNHLILALKQLNPGLDIEAKFQAGGVPLAIGLRKGETELQAWLNAWVTKRVNDRSLIEIYERFHEVKLDPTHLLQKL